MTTMRSTPSSASGSLPPRIRNCVLQAFALCSLVFIVVATQIPSSFLLDTPSIFRFSKRSTTDKFEHMFATKTKYWDQREGMNINNDPAVEGAILTFPGLADMNDQTPHQSKLELIQTQLVVRHGIRYPTGGNIKEINNLLEKLKPYQDSLPTWMKNYALPYNMSVAGELAVAGKHEISKLGTRARSKSGHEKPVIYLKEKYRITHTHITRTRDSAIAFVGSFFENPEDVEYIEYPKDKDVLLRFFDQCARYQREVKKNQTAQLQLHDFQKSSVLAKIALWLKYSLGLMQESIEFSSNDLMAVQSACAFDIALYHHKHHWCSLMSMTFIHSLDYLDDLEQFYWIGGGYKINYEMAAVLLRELFSTMKGRVNGSNTLVGNLFFAHAETTLPLMTLMGYGDRSLLLANSTDTEIKTRGFRTSILSPFAANIEFRLFKRKSSVQEFYVQILVNERKAKIPGCGHVFCKLSELEKQWDYYLNTYDFQKDCV
ncbi:hypothetical protein F441_19279 [Phytophthora nicotianae CJ01A1]|uniref:Multiple inositol polyphosphate phosphatase 1 n=18 Tax=Phytophthora nicotianae TaxID=4792 RepID=W2QY26_PHYN3|nr:hypothetical protein PPTG_05536 [Phytophthora nicotianae INRA-310]ETI33926.1 hypothetical protein F443_19460 [Phytophthora nicotianae P1569]ETK74285.1 hypothetical protein L915_18879 [Phytophthora nicotianae]ETO62716.1 hypothetical protein F444_19412 [Phytophthora nicotianae P1976]ETP03799.1 hypothetical protein F441_19279 [Phytophthora nicotianae CJ01A1]ETP31960.1 hypothetical protein F442_19229 [Phytophthora nicotianae P10297]